jgi:hypothetical protein
MLCSPPPEPAGEAADDEAGVAAVLWEAEEPVPPPHALRAIIPMMARMLSGRRIETLLVR